MERWDGSRRALAGFGCWVVAASGLFVGTNLGVAASGVLAVLGLAVAAVAVVPGAWDALYRWSGVSRPAWGVALAVVAAGYVATGVPTAAATDCGWRCFTPYGWAVLSFWASLLPVGVALGRLRRFRRRRSAPVTRAASVDDGVVAVEGTAEPDAEVLEAPVSGADAVWYRTWRDRRRGPLTTVAATETESVPFHVVDDTGRVRVEPSDVDDHDAFRHARTTLGTVDGDVVWEARVEADAPVTAVGDATRVPSGAYGASHVLGRDDGLVLAHRPLDDLASATTRTVLGMLALVAVYAVPTFLALLFYG